MNLLRWLEASPDAAVLACTAGILLIYVELNRPGLILAGAAGLLLFLLGVAALSNLQVWWPGVVLLALAVLTQAVGLRHKFTWWMALLLSAAVTAGCLRLLQVPGPHVHVLTALLAGVILGAGTSLLTSIARRARIHKGLDSK